MRLLNSKRHVRLHEFFRKGEGHTVIDADHIGFRLDHLGNYLFRVSADMIANDALAGMDVLHQLYRIGKDELDIILLSDDGP